MHEFFHAPQEKLLKDLGKAVDGYFVQGRCEMHVWKFETTHWEGRFFD
jgi:hypothetical protein